LAVDKKILDRVDKLLRLSAPNSNTNENERASAALEASKLIAEHDLIVKPREVRRKVTRPRAQTQQPSPWPTPVWSAQGTSMPGWARSRAARDGVCEDPECRGLIHRGDVVWARIVGFDTQYLHLGADCGW
jgi:hypothetical protein